MITVLRSSSGSDRFQPYKFQTVEYTIQILTAWHRIWIRIKTKTDTIQDKAFDEIKSSATLSLGRIEHSNLAGCLENTTLSFKKQSCARKCAYTMISR